jgi:MFS family permease
MTSGSMGTAHFRPRSLDALNFLLADVRGAVGPFQNAFLVIQQGWSQSSVGLMTTLSGLVGLAAQTPAGAAIDATSAKRGVVVVALAVLALAAVVIFTWPTFGPVLAANTLMAIVGDVFGPAVAALTLGLFAARQLPRQMGRNSALDHAGNVGIAVIAGAVGWLFGQRAVFLLVPVFAVMAAVAVLSIPAAAIDHRKARGAKAEVATENEAGAWALLQCRPLVIFAVCITLFHFANAPLLPLVGQKLATANPSLATAMMSFCIIAAQLVMLPVSDNHSRIRSSSCKYNPGSTLKYEAFLYIHVRLPSGELVALRMKLSDGHILRCYQRRRRTNQCGFRHAVTRAMGVEVAPSPTVVR